MLPVKWKASLRQAPGEMLALCTRTRLALVVDTTIGIRVSSRLSARMVILVSASVAIGVAATLASGAFAASLALPANAANVDSATSPTPAAYCTAPPWPRWQQFKRDFISPEGRVIDVGS